MFENPNYQNNVKRKRPAAASSKLSNIK